MSASPPAKAIFKHSGRGTEARPQPRFETLHVDHTEVVDESYGDEVSPIRTIFYKDATRSILTQNDSPDVGLKFTVNPYRGCEHGCIYCYARPTHEYLGLSAGLDFESKIFVKQDAAELLRQALSKKTWQPQPIGLSGVTDCYQPVERKMQLTRACLEVLAEFRNPAFVITKNHLVTRDIDVLQKLAEHRAVRVMISVTSLDSGLISKLEPRTSRPNYRLDAIRQLKAAGVPVGVMIAPVIPGLTDSEVPQILAEARSAGADAAGYVPLRLPFGVKDLFVDWLRREYPDRAERVVHRIQEIRGGKLNDSNFATRMRGQGVYAEQIRQLFTITKRKLGYGDFEDLNVDAFCNRRTVNAGAQSQLSLF